MKLSRFKEVVSKLYELERRQLSYIDGCPDDIRELLLNTQYINNACLQFDTLMNALFGYALAYDVYWLLLEWCPNSGQYLELDGAHYTINTLDEFFTYIELSYGLVD